MDKTILIKRIDAAVRVADEAFWEVIAKQFPEIKTGDLSPDAVFEFSRSCNKVVEQWYNANSPDSDVKHFEGDIYPYPGQIPSSENGLIVSPECVNHSGKRKRLTDES